MQNQISINCHSSIKITNSKNIYFDPYCITEENHDADYIFITHNHYDHLDIISIKNILKEDTLVIIPSSVSQKDLNLYIRQEQVITVSPNQHYNTIDISFDTVPSYNIDKEFHKKIYNWVGYIVEINNQKIYVAGDTDNLPELHNIKCDIALVPIGGTYTMNPQEAASLINVIKPSIVIPTHYGKIVGDYKNAQEFQSLLDEDVECKILINR